MATRTILAITHEAMPLSVITEQDSISGQFTIRVRVASVDLHIEHPGTELLARYRSAHLYGVWSETLNPVFEAGFIAGQGASCAKDA